MVAMAHELTRADFGNEFDRICEHGRELTTLESKIKWELADLCAKVQASGKFGENRMKAFAQYVGKSDKWVYNYAIQATFWTANARIEIAECEQYVRFGHCDLIRRHIPDLDKAIGWVVACEFNGWSLNELTAKLIESHGKPVPTAPLYKGMYKPAQMIAIINGLPHDKEYRFEVNEVQ